MREETSQARLACGPSSGFCVARTMLPALQRVLSTRQKRCRLVVFPGTHSEWAQWLPSGFSGPELPDRGRVLV